MAEFAMPAGTPAITPATPDELFVAAYVQYRAMVRWTIINRLVVVDYDLADDLTQDAFLRLYRYRDRLPSVRNIGGLLRVMARQVVCYHFRLLRNAREIPADTGHWAYANRELVSADGGYYKVTTGAHPDDSDPDMDEALRRVRTGRQLAGAR